MLIKINGGILAPKGFKMKTFCAGIKHSEADTVFITSEEAAVCAGVYTDNTVKAAPVKWSSFITNNFESTRGVLINIGTANVAAGDEGYESTVQLAKLAADSIGVMPENILCASIGTAEKKIPASNFEDKLRDVTFDKTYDFPLIIEIAAEFDIDGKKVKIGGLSVPVSEGGIIACVTTDVNITKELLDKALVCDYEDTYNMICSSWAGSANDSVFALASGRAGNKIIDSENSDYEAFCAALKYINLYLAKKMTDEELSQFFEVNVINAQNKKSAVGVSKAVAHSGSTDVYRILHIIGKQDAEFNPEIIDITLKSPEGSIPLVKNGLAANRETIMPDSKKINLVIDLKGGNYSAAAFGTR